MRRGVEFGRLHAALKEKKASKAVTCTEPEPPDRMSSGCGSLGGGSGGGGEPVPTKLRRSKA